MAQTGPNILFIMIDQLRIDYLSCAGHAHLKTPNIDRLAAIGALCQYLCALSGLRCQRDELLYRALSFKPHCRREQRSAESGEQTLGDHLRGQDVSS